MIPKEAVKTFYARLTSSEREARIVRNHERVNAYYAAKEKLEVTAKSVRASLIADDRAIKREVEFLERINLLKAEEEVERAKRRAEKLAQDERDKIANAKKIEEDEKEAERLKLLYEKQELLDGKKELAKEEFSYLKPKQLMTENELEFFKRLTTALPEYLVQSQVSDGRNY